MCLAAAFVAFSLRDRAGFARFGCQVWLSDGTGTLSDMPREHIKVRSSWQKFQHGEVAAVIVPVMGRFNRVVAVDVPNLPESPEYSLR